MQLSAFARHAISAKPVRRRKQSEPIWLVILGYLALISVGTLLLSLPLAQDKFVPFIDNFFVATSAVCVTGLSTVDVGVVYSHFGHWVLLCLMQAGGLGIMAISTSLILLAGMRPGFGHQSVLMDQFSQEGNIAPKAVLRAVFPFMFGMEALGLVVYFTQFPEEDLYDRFFSALFQTVSSFCNVGFTLYPDSLVQFGMNWIVVVATAVLVLAGGFGFLAVADLSCIFSSKKKVSLHTKLALLITVFFVLAGFVACLGFEFTNALGDKSFGYKALSAFSYSAISRTAGLNLFDMSLLSGGALWLTVILMFIGANPGSCGGGIKTTTAAVIFMLGLNRFRGREKTQIFGRTIPHDTVQKAVYIFLIAIIVITLATFALLITETGARPYSESSGAFLRIFFEVVSAYSTCGLSLGITPELTTSGRALICLVMFIGRLGPLFLISAVASREKDSGMWYSEENIMVG